jgi:transcriptional pleiotropic regulator of transition state genes
MTLQMSPLPSRDQRRRLDLADKDALEIYMDESSIVLMKYEPACIFCGDIKNMKNYKGKNICDACIVELRHCRQR